MLLIPHYVLHPFYDIPGLHLLYTCDHHRVNPYKLAIAETIKPEEVVLEIGAGTGILSRFAVEAGAKRVYAVETSREMLRYAERINVTAGMDQRIVLIHGNSFQTELQEKSDVLVAEIIGGIGNDEGISTIIEDARERLLKPGGKLIPREIEVYLCPICVPEAHAQIPHVYDQDLIVPPEKGRPPFRAYYQIIGLKPELILAEQKLLDQIDLCGHTKPTFQRGFEFTIERNGIFSGFAAWFKARLSETIILDTSPWAPPTCWGQAYFAVQHQCEVQKSDLLELTFSARKDGEAFPPVYTWTGSISRGKDTVLDFEETSETATS